MFHKFFHDGKNFSSGLTSPISLHAQVQFHAKYPLFYHSDREFTFSCAILNVIDLFVLFFFFFFFIFVFQRIQINLQVSNKLHSISIIISCCLHQTITVLHFGSNFTGLTKTLFDQYSPSCCMHCSRIASCFPALVLRMYV